MGTDLVHPQGFSQVKYEIVVTHAKMRFKNH